MAQAGLGAVVVATELDPWWVTAHFVDRPAPDRGRDRTSRPPTRAGPTADDGRHERTAGGGRSFARLALVTADRRRTPPPGRHVRPGERRAARVHGLALDGREARADARRRRHGDVPAPGARRDRDAARPVDRDPGPDRRSTGDASLVRLSTTALVLFVAQIMVGAANVWTRLRPWAVVAHVALSVLIWATVVALATVRRGSRQGNRHAEPNADEVDGRANVRRSATPSPRTTGSRSHASSCCC